MSNLQLHVTQGTLKKSSEILGKMDNYVLVRLHSGGKTNDYKSTIVPGAAKEKPITWNYTFNIPISQAQRDARLEVWVKDEDMTKDDINGKGWVNVERCGMFNGRGSYQLRLHGDNKKQEHAGDLYFTTNYS